MFRYGARTAWVVRRDVKIRSASVIILTITCHEPVVTMRTCQVLPIAVIGVLLTAVPTAAQQNPGGLGPRQLGEPAVRSAVEAARQLEPDVVADQIALCEIPAPPFGEAARAAAYRDRFAALGLTDVRVDAVGNVLGVRAGRQPHPHLVLSAHLDTVFPAETDVTVTRDGAVLKGSGIGDDCRGLAVLLGVIRALDGANVTTTGSITFVETIGEEGLGDLRGVKHLFEDELAEQVDRFVSVDGAGLGITNGAVGSLRYRVTFRGPGGHSFGAFGLASPVHALGRLISAVSDFDVPNMPKTTFTVGRVGGGTSVNVIAADAWAEIDMRSTDATALARLEAMLLRAVDSALATENARWGRGGRLSVESIKVGERPAGMTDPAAAIVRAALSVSAALGMRLRLSSGSTDANIPISLGIPAITIDGGGSGFGAHSEHETFDTTAAARGTERATLLAVALTEP